MKLGIQPLMPTGNFLNKRYSIEQDFPDDSNPLDNYKYLNEVVTAVHMIEYPMCYKDGKPLFSNYQGDDRVDNTVKDKVSDSIQVTLDFIKNSKDKNELESVWLISKSNLTLSQAYKLKEKDLQNAQ